MALVKYNNNSISDVTAFASVPSGAMTLIKTLTASSSATLSFVNGSSDVVLDGTYPVYKFVFINIHPASANTELTFNMSTDTGSNYNVAKTTTFIQVDHSEGGAGESIQLSTGDDLAQGTGFQNLTDVIDNDNDNSGNGSLLLFSPSSTTFVKQFISRGNGMYNGNYISDCFVAGYGNTTSAVDAVQFKMASGNIDAGTIKLYGIKDS
jgi:hypothetical protein